MKSKRNKLFIFAMAFVMFTSTWAGAFAAEPEQSEEPAGAEVVAVENGDAVVGESNMAAPTAEQKGNNIHVSWTAPQDITESISYEVLQYKGSEETGTSVYTGAETTCKVTPEEDADYTFTVTATIGETKGEESAKSGKVKFQKIAAPADVTGIEALSGCNMVSVRWTEVQDADGYVIKKYDSAAQYNQDRPSVVRVFKKDNSYFKKTGPQKKLTWENVYGVSAGSDYWYRVYAANNITSEEALTGDEILSVNPAAISKGPVRPMYISFKFKKSRTLKSRTGGKVKTKFYKNQEVLSTGYGGGCYYFNYGGRSYRVSRTSAKKAVAYYNGRGNWDYTPEEAELFVNRCGVGSSTNLYIWVSFYTQRLYVFDRGGSEYGTWRCITNWDCATGKAGTPSPTGVKAIGKFHKKSHHGIKWWSGFSGGNSIHGKKSGWKLGLPQSHGCIRNEVPNAKFVFDNCKKNTRVYNY